MLSLLRKAYCDAVYRRVGSLLAPRLLVAGVGDEFSRLLPMSGVQAAGPLAPAGRR